MKLRLIASTTMGFEALLKQELIKLGFFDDVDIAMLTHTGSELPGTLGIGGSNNGMVGKTMHQVNENSQINDIKQLSKIYENFLENIFKDKFF